MNFNPDNPVPLFQEEALEKYLNMEMDWMAADGYAESPEATLRNRALTVILELSKCENFDAFIPYLAMNYFDRFISKNQIPNVPRRVRDVVEIVAIGCLMLAWKMRDNSFEVHEFLQEKNIPKDYQDHLLLVELAILNGLDWRMRPITPLCFVDLFVRKIPGGDAINGRKVNEIIIQIQGVVAFTKFRPSVIAAAAVLWACRDLRSDRYIRSRRSLLASVPLKADDLNACFIKIFDFCVENRILYELVGFWEEPVLELVAGHASQVGGTSQAEQTSQVGEISQAEQASISGQTSQIGEISQSEQTSQAGETSRAAQSYQAGETSKAGQTSQAGETSQVGQASQAGETSSLIPRRTGKEPMEYISEIPGSPGQEPMENISEIPRRPGKEPMEDISEIPGSPGQEPMENISEIPRSPGNEQMQDSPEIQEVKDDEDPETENGQLLNFELKWTAQEVTIDSPLFRPVAETPSDQNDNPQNDSPQNDKPQWSRTTCFPGINENCNLL